MLTNPIFKSDSSRDEFYAWMEFSIIMRSIELTFGRMNNNKVKKKKSDHGDKSKVFVLQ